MVGIKLNPDGFQGRLSNYLLRFTADKTKPKTLIVKAPTGAGKTVVLIDYIEKYNTIFENNVFIWLSPGGGELEEQSQKSMEEKSPESSVKNLQELLASGFESKDVVFINWELVTKSGNKAVNKVERQNLFDRIAVAHKQGLDFIIIVDEEHSNDTKKALDIINAFACIKEIRVSATANKRANADYYEVLESEVIAEGFITKAIYINAGLINIEVNQDNENILLLKTGLEQRTKILNEYKAVGKKINPLLVIQFPNSSNQLIKTIESFLFDLGITYENKLLAKWLSEEKHNIGQLEDDNGEQIVLIMKQAISTGWDCPRAKVLVKLRENMNEEFEIQTIGRIRRMPERKHYGKEDLDCCFLYTFDTKYVEGVRESTSSIFNVKEVKAKEKTQSTKLVKELKDKTFLGINERKAFETIVEYYINTYHLEGKNNEKLLEANGYNMSSEIETKVLTGRFQKITDIPLEVNSDYYFNLKYEVNTHAHGMDLLHSTYAIAKSVGLDYDKFNSILYQMFRKDIINRKKKILKLNKKEYYAFVINNEEKLRADFKLATSQMTKALKLNLNINKVEFVIPYIETLKYIESEKANAVIESNAYYDYTEQSLVEGLRSTSEILFENYCENNPNVDWVYKNGDRGDQYLSVVYLDALYKQWLFYPDYIVKLKNDTIIIVETKGGESHGVDKNIDKQVKNKFVAFKQYAESNKLQWGFVRDKNSRLYFNNTNYVDELSDASWQPLKELF